MQACLNYAGKPAGRQGPATHDHESADGECKAETGRAAPIVTDQGRVADVELPQQAREICDLFADGFLDRPTPMMSGTITRRPKAVSGFTNFLYGNPKAGLPRGRTTGSLLPSSMQCMGQPLTRLDPGSYGHS